MSLAAVAKNELELACWIRSALVRGGVGGQTKEELREDAAEERLEMEELVESEEEERVGELFGEAKRREEYADAGLSVTQPNDPLSGGHFALGASKTPLETEIRRSGEMLEKGKKRDIPRVRQRR